MKRLMAVAATLFMMPVAAGAQDAIPALKGTWRGTGKILLFGTTEHLSGSPQNAVVRDLEVSSRPEESHRRALPEPCMTLSSHTAPDVRPLP
jgi:hypothetical protein